MNNSDITTQQRQDTNLRQAIDRRERQRPQMPDDLGSRLMQRMDASRRNRTRWMLKAACALIMIIGVGTAVLMKDWTSQPPRPSVPPRPGNVAIRQQGETSTKVATHTSLIANTTKRTPARTSRRASAPVRKSPTPPPKTGETAANPTDQNLHYASHENKEDSTRLDPAKVDEFIGKLAETYALKDVELRCTATLDSTVSNAVYVFPDKKEVNVFGRMLQVACCFSDDTPGYLLNFSHLQFFFQLKDMRRQLQYRWIAERLNGRILLYASHAPIGVTISSACYQEYREQLTHTGIKNIKPIEL